MIKLKRQVVNNMMTRENCNIRPICRRCKLNDSQEFLRSFPSLKEINILKQKDECGTMKSKNKGMIVSPDALSFLAIPNHTSCLVFIKDLRLRIRNKQCNDDYLYALNKFISPVYERSVILFRD